ncbi:MAG: 4Fe-4S binding protein [Oscillospiraceae bacterium]|nr:4Fe-4S binding protein [Oscillospiraceae bacterium]
MKTKISFNEEACKGCGLCILWCKKGLLSKDKSKLNRYGVHPAHIEDPQACVACGNCALMCPDGVITIEKTED